MRRAIVLLVLSCAGAKQPAPVATVAPATNTKPTEAAPSARGVVRVHFEGARAVSQEDLRAVILIDKPEKAKGATNREVIERDALYVQALLYDRGYINSKIATPRVEIAEDGGVDVTFVIEEGARYRLSKIEVREHDGSAPLARMTRATAGAWFARNALIEDLTALRTAYRDASYANVDAEPDTVIHEDTRTVDVTVVIDRGPKCFFGAVRAEPATLAPAILEAARAEGVTSGASFNETKLLRVKRAAEGRGAVEIAVTTSHDTKPDRIDVTFEAH